MLKPGAQITKVCAETVSAYQDLVLSVQLDAVVLQIKFSTKSFGRDAAQVAAKAIANNSGTLVEADLSDIIAGRPEAEALESLTNHLPGIIARQGCLIIFHQNVRYAAS